MDTLKRLTIEMKKQLLTDNLTEFGALLHEAWVSKCKMASQISNARINEMYEAARKAGALGGKIDLCHEGTYSHRPISFFFCAEVLGIASIGGEAGSIQ